MTAVLTVTVLGALDTEARSAPGDGTTLQVGRAVSFQVTNPGLTDRHLRHQGSVARAEVVNAGSSTTLKEDASFRIVAALDGTPCYSFESVNFPGHYLRHAGYQLRKDALVDTTLFRQDATWCAQQGLSGTGVSLASRNFPQRYLRHRSAQVWLDAPEETAARCSARTRRGTS